MADEQIYEDAKGKYRKVGLRFLPVFGWTTAVFLAFMIYGHFAQTRDGNVSSLPTDTVGLVSSLAGSACALFSLSFLVAGLGWLLTGKKKEYIQMPEPEKEESP